MRTELKKYTFVIVSFFFAALVNAADLQSEICQPAPDGQSCNQTVCPDSNQQCIPTKIRVNYNGQSPTYTVLECECMNVQTDCHININPQFDVYATGTCPDPNYQCQLTETDNGNGTIDYECNCAPIRAELTLGDLLDEQASNPSPADGATDVNHAGVTLSWTAGSGALSHDVYFGTANPPVTIKGTYTAASCPTGTMVQGRLYYWRIDEKNAGGTTTGNIWNFRVEECYKSSGPSYSDWVNLGRPSCWCFQRYCRGDFDGAKAGVQFVGANDLNALITAYGKNLTWITQNPQYLCADFDHAKVGAQRVQANDLNTLISYYGKNATFVSVCPSSAVNFWTN